MTTAKALVVSNDTYEVLVHDEYLSMCMLVHPRSRVMRVFDFRAGAVAAKRDEVLKVARRGGVQRVFTIVEREEVGTWHRLGFAREGTISGFFRRTDGFVLGLATDGRGPPAHARFSPEEDMDDGSGAFSIADLRLADATLKEARLFASERWTKNGTIRLHVDAEEPVQHSLDERDSFGRDGVVVRTTALCRNQPVATFLAEKQRCFAHALVEVSSVVDDRGRHNAFALASFCLALHRDGMTSLFAMSDALDVARAALFLGAGFRRTGVLAKHLSTPGGRLDALLWSRKWAPNDDA